MVGSNFSNDLQSTINVIISLFLITWLFRRWAVLPHPSGLRGWSLTRMFTNLMEICTYRTLMGLSKNPKHFQAEKQLPLCKHTLTVPASSSVMILIVTVGLVDINKALPVNPLPSAETKAWNFPADFLQWPGSHHHTLTAGEWLNLHKGWSEWENLECCSSWVLTAWQGSRAACLALCMLSVNHLTEPLNSSITVGYKSPFLQ